MNIELKNISKKYNNNIIFSSLNFTFKENEITCIMGPTGSGKTTLMKMISNLTQYQGEITKIDDISFVFQEHRLIENLTVYQNLEYIIKKVYKSKVERKQVISNMLKKMKLEKYSHYFPKELSGGTCQRVSIARALLYPSSLLILDEPFKQLDELTKKDIITEFFNILKDNKKTVIYITHDLAEAKSITNNIYLIKDKSTLIKI